MARPGEAGGPDRRPQLTPTTRALLRQVWARRGNANPKIVRAYVKRLRHQLGDDAARPAWIFNERGVGYRMARPGEAGEP